MYFQPVDLTTALRPSLLPDETLLFVQDAVGLYEGKYKIPRMQNGHAYLTSHRACYVDNAEPRKNSVAVELKSIEKYEFYAGFLKSSPKISLYPKVASGSATPGRSQSAVSTPQLSAYLQRGNSTSSRGSSIFDAPFQRSSSPNTSSVTWICPICSQPNQLPPHFDATTANVHTSLAPCSTCGVKPSLAHVLKAAINGASGRPAGTATETSSQPLFENQQQLQRSSGGRPSLVSAKPPPQAFESSFQCPRCTFLNHPSLPNCELCGASLSYVDLGEQSSLLNGMQRPESPGPTIESHISDIDHSSECVKLSFRVGGEKVFHERLKGAMLQRKWLLKNAPPVPRPNQWQRGSATGLPTHDAQLNGTVPRERSKIVGIAGLERRGIELRKNNEVVLGNAFEDLEALMASAKEIVALAETFANKSPDSGTEAANALLQESATALGMVTTKEMLKSSAGSDSLYLSELSRNLAEYLTDDAKGILHKEGGIMSLVDLWCVFNRARGGVELVSPMDFEKAARLWGKLNLPVRLRQFKNGLLVVQRYDWTDDKTIAQLLNWFQELHTLPPPGETCWDWEVFGRGITAQEAAQKFGWSLGVATEELEMAEENGALCREESVEGLRFWENCIVEEDDIASFAPQIDPETLAVTRNLEDLGLCAAVSAHSIEYPPLSNQAVLQGASSTDRFLVELEPGETKWISEDEKWELRRNGINFMDITDNPELGALSVLSKKARVHYPQEPAYNETVSSMLKELSKKNMEKHLTRFTAFHTRYYKSAYGAQSSAWLLGKVNETIQGSEAAKHGSYVKAFEHPWGQSSIIATIPGRSNKTVVIGAHQDSINLFFPSFLAAPGADDDGSGTVTILEALRVLLESDAIAHGNASNTLEFQWYSAEEGGLLGSQAIFSAYEKEGRDVKAMLQQDMTGYVEKTLQAGEPESVGVITDFVDPGLTDFIKKVITTYCNIPYVLTKCGYACSDHASASKAGYPSAFVIESDFKYSDNKIHTSEDKIEYLNFDHMLQHARLTLGLAYELAFASFD